LKVVLVDIPILEVDNGYSIVHKEILFPALGLYYLQEYVRNHNKNISIEILQHSHLSFEESIDIVLQKDAAVVGITCYTDRRVNVFRYCKELKKKRVDIKLILGGPHASALAKQILQNYEFIDFIVIGEGELTFSELLEYLSNNNEDYSKINGIAYRDNQNKITLTPPRQPIENLDNLPYPKFDVIPKNMFKFTHYDNRIKLNGSQPSALKTMSIITSRGCPFKCTYCSTTAFWGRKVRYRSAENVVEEIEYLYSKHSVEFINIIDDAFTINRQRVIDICNLLISKKIKVYWICETNVKTIDLELLKIMKSAGCFAINYGVESGAPAILTNIKKNITLKEIENAIIAGKNAGMLADIFLMVGNPGENKKTINQTINLLKRCQPSSGGWGILTIFPATEIYEDCLKNNYISEDYWLSDKSSPFYLFENSYIQLRIFLYKIQCFFLWKDKKYRLWLRYWLLMLRDIIFLKTSIKLSLKKIVQFDKAIKFRKPQKKYII